MRSQLRILLLLVLGAITVSGALAQSRRQPPYWASISSGRAMMRAGPARTYPGTWLYVRADLPVRVTEVYQSWRKIQDPDGTTGWMLVNLLSDQRTGLVTGDGPRPMHARPDLASPVRYRAAPGVVGRISRCREGWCRFEVGSRDGYIRSDHIWGLGRNEQVD